MQSVQATMPRIPRGFWERNLLVYLAELLEATLPLLWTREKEACNPWSYWQLWVPTRGSQLKDEGLGADSWKETTSSVTVEMWIQTTPEVLNCWTSTYRIQSIPFISCASISWFSCYLRPSTP